MNETWRAIASICITLFIIALIFFVAWWFIAWYNSRDRATKLRYKSFKTFYKLNPDRWMLKDYYVKCQIVNDKARMYGSLFNHYEDFHFGPIDFLKYKLWLRREERKDKYKEGVKATAEMLRSVNYDIETIKRRAKDQQLQAIDDLQQIVNNLKRSSS